jgi:hypothetical protein
MPSKPLREQLRVDLFGRLDLRGQLHLRELAAVEDALEELAPLLERERARVDVCVGDQIEDHVADLRRCGVPAEFRHDALSRAPFVHNVAVLHGQSDDLAVEDGAGRAVGEQLALDDREQPVVRLAGAAVEVHMIVAHDRQDPPPVVLHLANLVRGVHDGEALRRLRVLSQLAGGGGGPKIGSREVDLIHGLSLVGNMDDPSTSANIVGVSFPDQGAPV